MAAASVICTVVAMEPSDSGQNSAQVPLQCIKVPHILSATMRTLGISAIVMAATLATISIIFIGLAHHNRWSGGPACSMAESLCRRPSLIAIPILASIAWGLMLMTDKSE